MPRDASGTYTTPAGQPVTSGTAISAAVFNALVNDLKAEMTDSLSRSGKGGMSVPLPFSDGTVSAPGISFDNEKNTGLYRKGAGDVRLSVLGTDLMQWKSTGANKVIATTSTGGFTHTGDTNFTDVTNATVTITTVGRPVFVFLQSDAVGSAGSSGGVAVTSDGGGARTGTFKLVRDVTDISIQEMLLPLSTYVMVPCGCIMFLDTPAAGSHTYKLQVKIDNALGDIRVFYAKLVAYEI